MIRKVRCFPCLAKKPLSQAMVDYAMVVAVAALALAAMGTYINRAFQGKYRESADSLASQYDPDKTSGYTTVTTTSTSNLTREGNTSITETDSKESISVNERVSRK